MAVSNWVRHILKHYDIPFEERHHAPVHAASRRVRERGGLKVSAPRAPTSMTSVPSKRAVAQG